LISRFLVTTALEKTWPDDPKTPVLFLGEWCRLFIRKELWSKMNATVLPYHWDDRHKLYNDYKYLNHIYENTLKALQKQLNEIHGVDHSLRYWRILIGPWLEWFIQIVFDRWTMLKHAFEKYEISGCRILVKNKIDLIPNDMNEFNKLLIDDNWNEMIYSQLLQEHLKYDISVEQVKENNGQPNQAQQTNNTIETFYTRIKKFLANLQPNTKNWIANADEYFFLSTYLPKSIEEELLLRLGQNPKSWELPSMPVTKVNKRMREWMVNVNDSTNQFSIVLCRMIPHHIPVAYLEGYKTLVDYIDNIAWPKTPKCIFTSVAYSSYDVFKAWVAQKTENGSPLVIGQHGGHVGATLWASEYEHQINIADKWISWGWSDEKTTNIIPVGNLKVINSTLNYDPNGYALMVGNASPRYSYQMHALPVAGQWLSYFDDQCLFISALPMHLRLRVMVRLYLHDFGWYQKERWRDSFPYIELDESHEHIYKFFNKCCISISTYNSTTILESLVFNIPTITFWNPKHWELRDDAIPYFELLKSVNILHETPESAADYMANIWDDISAWWYSYEVQKVREKFCERYSHIPEKPLDKLETIFRELSVEVET
tara:strand:- start:4431 stop:6227 length:1797 start_codon:yes stop_codon:yes gene_type:complete